MTQIQVVISRIPSKFFEHLRRAIHDGRDFGIGRVTCPKGSIRWFIQMGKPGKNARQAARDEAAYPYIVGGMATMPSRANTAPRAILSALANVDRLFLYLDRFDQVPAYAFHKRISVLRSQDYGEIGANGKLLGLKLCPEADYYMCFDDDYLYSPGFARYLLANCKKYGDRVAVGVHGSIFNRKVDSYVRDRKVINGWRRFARDRRVDILATCGTLHLIEALNFDVQQWTCSNIVDINFAWEAKKSGIPLRVVGRYKRLIKVLEYKQPDSIYRNLLENDAHQTQLVRRLLNG